MPTTSGEIVINADPALILDIVGDLERYPEWTEGTEGVEIIEALTPCRPLIAKLTFAAGPLKGTFTLQYEWNDDESVKWWLTEGSVITKEDGSYELTVQDDGSVLAKYELEIDTSMKLPSFLKKQAQKKIIKTGLEGLKKRAESLQQQ